MKKSLLLVCFSLVASLPAIAGDVATFVDLGFSPDSSYFMFGQYGVDQTSGTPYAETFLVDNKTNDFVRHGTARKTYATPLEAGQDASGAFFALFAEQVTLVKKYKIDHLKPGRLLYLLVDGQEPPALLSFRDFKTGSTYEVSLNQKSTVSAGTISSSFGVSLSKVSKDGTTKRVAGGNPDIKRAGVKEYVIRRIIAAPDETTFIFIVEKRMVEKSGGAIRYMVEALRLP